MDRNHYRGKFIVFEGLDGSGQSTQAGKLVDYLDKPEQKNKFGHVGVQLTKEPTTGLIGGLIRSQLSHDWKSSQECLQLLFSADRAHHLEKEIIPLLKRGACVVCDRYFFSTVAYGSINVDRDWLLSLNENFILPDITFLIKVSPKICVERIHKSRFGVELFEKEDILTKVWKEYSRLARKFSGVCIIDGEKSMDEVFEEIKNKCEKALLDRKPLIL